jgi:hypothetical protein
MGVCINGWYHDNRMLNSSYRKNRQEGLIVRQNDRLRKRATRKAYLPVSPMPGRNLFPGFLPRRQGPERCFPELHVNGWLVPSESAW